MSLRWLDFFLSELSLRNFKHTCHFNNNPFLQWKLIQRIEMWGSVILGNLWFEKKSAHILSGENRVSLDWREVS